MSRCSQLLKINTFFLQFATREHYTVFISWCFHPSDIKNNRSQYIRQRLCWLTVLHSCEMSAWLTRAAAVYPWWPGGCSRLDVASLFTEYFYVVFFCFHPSLSGPTVSGVKVAIVGKQACWHLGLEEHQHACLQHMVARAVCHFLPLEAGTVRSPQTHSNLDISQLSPPFQGASFYIQIW